MIRRSKGLISKEQYKISRNRGFTSEGEKHSKGNRYFKFDIANNVIVYKRSRKEHIVLNLPKLKKKVKNELLLVQEAMENKMITATVKIKNNYIFITFDESVIYNKAQRTDLLTNRILGIDLNPNYIGVSILEFDVDDSFKVIHKEVYDVHELQRAGKNKAKHELLEINHRIIRMAEHWKCAKIAVEELSIYSKNNRKGKDFNRLCNNEWRRNATVSNLQILSNTHGIELVKINPAYTSFIGNCLHGNETTPDMVASSIEIARRGYKKFSKGWFYPAYDGKAVSQTLNQWKEMMFEECKSWVEAFNIVKNSKIRYRVQLDARRCCFQKIYHNSKMTKLCFS